MFEPKPDPMISRDLVGYGEFPPNPAWPGGATIAVNFNLNVEGGGEATLANGDDVSEGMLNDIGVNTQARVRVPLVESVFEYGTRRGVWGLLDIFREFKSTSAFSASRGRWSKIRNWPRRSLNAATRSSVMGIAGSIIARSLRTWNVSTSIVRLRY